MGWNLNDSTTSLLPNVSFLSRAKLLHSTKMWRTVRIHRQRIHIEVEDLSSRYMNASNGSTNGTCYCKYPPDSHARDTWLVYSGNTQGITRLTLATAQKSTKYMAIINKTVLLALELGVTRRLIRSIQS